MGRRIVIDFETYSDVDLDATDQYAYMEHSSTRILMMSYKDAGVKEDAKVWYPTEPFPFEFGPDITIVAHHVEFEIAVINRFLGGLKGAKVSCTSVRARAVGMPGSLDGACQALKVANQKHPDGRRLIKVFCVPGGMARMKPGDAQKFVRYCQDDVLACDDLDQILPELEPSEYDLFLLHLKINARGAQADYQLAHQLKEISEYATKVLVDQDPIIRSPVKLRERLGLPDCTQDTLTARLEDDDCSEEDRLLIELRLGVRPAAVKKLGRVQADRIRGTHVMGGAHTGRFSGAGFQTHNMLKASHDDVPTALAYAELIRHLPVDVQVALLGGPAEALQFAAKSTRPIICGDMVVVDFSAIEAVQSAWFCDDEFLNGAFLRKEPVYSMMGAKVKRIPVEQAGKGTRARDFGKNLVLGCQYGLGPAGFVAYCARNKMDITLEEGTEAVGTYRTTAVGMPRMWKKIENQWANAMQAPGQIFELGHNSALAYDGNTMFLRLPSGRLLRYHFPAYVQLPNDDRWQISYLALNKTKGRSVEKAGVDPRQWPSLPGFFRTLSFGGKILENIIQAHARDILCFAMKNLDMLGYDIWLHIHDEVVVGAPASELKNVEEIMSIVPPFAQGSIVGVEGWAGTRYRK